MPFRSPKMNSFIFGFHRLVWWPKCTPASSRSFIAIPDKCFSFSFRLPPEATRLTLAELEALAGAGQTVLLPFLDARVGRQQPVLLQLLPEFRIELDERTRDAKANRARLAVDAATGHRRQDVELVRHLRQRERTPDVHPQRVGGEVVRELAVVDGDGA